MANLMNNYFTNVEPSLAANMNDPWVCNGNVSDITLIDDFYVETEELLKLLQDIDISKSAGIEYLGSNNLKDALITLIDEFRYILNLFISTGTFF